MEKSWSRALGALILVLLGGAIAAAIVKEPEKAPIALPTALPTTPEPAATIPPASPTFEETPFPEEAPLPEESPSPQVLPTRTVQPEPSPTLPRTGEDTVPVWSAILLGLALGATALAVGKRRSA